MNGPVPNMTILKMSIMVAHFRTIVIDISTPYKNNFRNNTDESVNLESTELVEMANYNVI